MQTPTQTASPRAFRPLLLLALSIPAALLMAPLTIVIAAAMAPTLVARLIDSGRPSYLSVTVGCGNLVGALYFVEILRSAGMRIENVGFVLRDPLGWAAALGGAGVGWLIFLCAPIVVHIIAQAQTSVRLRRMRREQQRLIDDWGAEVGEETSETS